MELEVKECTVHRMDQFEFEFIIVVRSLRMWLNFNSDAMISLPDKGAVLALFHFIELITRYYYPLNMSQGRKSFRKHEKYIKIKYLNDLL